MNHFSFYETPHIAKLGHFFGILSGVGDGIWAAAFLHRGWLKINRNGKNKQRLARDRGGQPVYFTAKNAERSEHYAPCMGVWGGGLAGEAGAFSLQHLGIVNHKVVSRFS